MSKSKKKRKNMIKKLLPKVHNSKNEFVEFDPKFIIDSIIRETNIGKNMANKLTTQLVKELVQLNLKYLTAPQIREMLCAIMIEKELFKDRLKYTRIGFPFYDINKIMNIDKEILRRDKVYNHIKEEYEAVKKLIMKVENISELDD